MTDQMNYLPLWMKGFDDPALLTTLDSQARALSWLQDHLETLAVATATADGASTDEAETPAEAGNDASGENEADDMLERLSDLCRPLDTALLKTACSVMSKCVVEAAVETGAGLLANSVTEVSDPESCQVKWARWLLSQRCWPTLVVDHWRRIRGRAETIVGKRLEKSSGISSDSAAAEEIMAGLRDLVLADVISPVTYRAVFPNEECGEEQVDGTVEAIETW